MHWLWWRFWGCPRTVETAAADFLHLRAGGPRVREVLRIPETWGYATTTDFTRRIAYVYGLGNVKRVELDKPDVWSVGWNRRLLRACGTPSDPGAAADRILERVCEMARHLPRQIRSETDASPGT